MDTTTDQKYINKVLQGDTNAFSYLVDKYKNMTYTVALKIVRNNEDAEEVAQDSFIKAYSQLHTFKGDSKFSTWLYTIVYRNAISKIRKKKITTTNIDSFVIENHKTDFDFPQIEAIKNGEQKKYVAEAINNLPEMDAFLITLFYLNESSVEEIEEITGLTKTNIKVKLFRARKKLYSELSLLLKDELKAII
ncbi:MAG: sigma-70 family RNA polymerase sigma factor [Flavobacteriaceae bacterium]|nr:sigma-70 family RNA polymerase sigma factor [Flavobacteriaceae bacterium]